MKKFLLSIVTVLSLSSSVWAQNGVQTPINSDGITAMRLLSAHCMDALNDAAKTGAWIGNVSYSGKFNSSDLTISYYMFRQTDFLGTESAGIIVLQVSPIKIIASDGPSISYTCTY